MNKFKWSACKKKTTHVASSQWPKCHNCLDNTCSIYRPPCKYYEGQTQLIWLYKQKAQVLVLHMQICSTRPKSHNCSLIFLNSDKGNQLYWFKNLCTCSPPLLSLSLPPPFQLWEVGINLHASSFSLIIFVRMIQMMSELNKETLKVLVIFFFSWVQTIRLEDKMNPTNYIVKKKKFQLK